jgi:hypothetical protein
MRLDINNNRDISDIPLIGNPQITYFKSVYRRHTHFIVDRHKQNCDPGNIANKILHLGHLIKSIDLEMNITGNTKTISSTHNIGTALIDNIKLRNNGTVIEELKGEYIEMYMELKNPRGLKTFSIADSDSKLQCKQGTMEQILSLSGGVFATATASKAAIILPIPFSFCRDIGHALPIFLLGNNNLQVYLETNKDVVSTTPEFHLIINYIYLSENEQMRFKISKNEYLHEFIKEQQIKTQDGENILELNPVGNIKSIMWGKTTSIDYKYNIKVTNRKLFIQDKSYHYFTRKTISDAGYPGGSCAKNSTTDVIHDDKIGFYSFALKGYDKEDPLAPTGSISSNSNKIELIIDNYNNNESEIIKVYTKSYNIISISNNKLKLEYQH